VLLEEKRTLVVAERAAATAGSSEAPLLNVFALLCRAVFSVILAFRYMRRSTCTINYGNEMPLAQGITFDV
jgi:hypothetical protein